MLQAQGILHYGIILVELIFTYNPMMELQTQVWVGIKYTTLETLQIITQIGTLHIQHHKPIQLQ
ncbi:hypothetical protein THIOSC13_1380003 [uncultured Thiomicrorhabdus sp.]